MSIAMNDKFYMFPINEVGSEKEVKGHKIDGILYGLSFNLYYIVIENVRLLVDSITGMAVWGAFDDPDQKVTDIDVYISGELKKDHVLEGIKGTHNNALRNGIMLTNCSETIKYVFEKQNIVSKKTLKSREGIAMDIATKSGLMNNFSQVFVDKDFGNQTVTNNSLIINPLHYVIPVGRKKIEIDLEKETVLTLAEIPSKNVIRIGVQERGFTDVIYKFKVKDYIIGYYLPENNVLIFGDILYNEMEWFNNVAKFIKKNFLRDIPKVEFNSDFEITMGCDPEFELYGNDNKLITGHDLNADGRLQKKIGADGAGRQLELRPEPSHDPMLVVDDLSKLFGSLTHLRVDAKGDHQAIGGHIHFGCISNKFVVSLKNTQIINDMLDTFVGRHTSKLNGKARGEYGRLGDVRQQPWGFEYRVPPAGVFATKKMAYITLKLCKNLIETIQKQNIEVEYPITKKSLLPFLTAEEADYYLNFPEYFKTINPCNIAQYWTDKKQQPIEIRFYDKWSKSTKEKYVSILKDTIIDGPTVLCLYGLKGDFYSGLECFGNGVPHPRGVHCNEGIAIGLPRTARLEEYALKEICSDIKKKIGTINGTLLKRTTTNLFPDELIGCQVKDNADLADGDL